MTRRSLEEFERKTPPHDPKKGFFGIRVVATGLLATAVGPILLVVEGFSAGAVVLFEVVAVSILALGLAMLRSGI